MCDFDNCTNPDETSISFGVGVAFSCKEHKQHFMDRRQQLKDKDNARAISRLTR